MPGKTLASTADSPQTAEDLRHGGKDPEVASTGQLRDFAAVDPVAKCKAQGGTIDKELRACKLP